MDEDLLKGVDDNEIKSRPRQKSYVTGADGGPIAGRDPSPGAAGKGTSPLPRKGGTVYDYGGPDATNTRRRASLASGASPGAIVSPLVAPPGQSPGQSVLGLAGGAVSGTPKPDARACAASALWSQGSQQPSDRNSGSGMPVKERASAFRSRRLTADNPDLEKAIDAMASEEEAKVTAAALAAAAEEAQAAVARLKAAVAQPTEALLSPRTPGANSTRESSRRPSHSSCISLDEIIDEMPPVVRRVRQTSERDLLRVRALMRGSGT